jgi:hypothetical protein
MQAASMNVGATAAPQNNSFMLLVISSERTQDKGTTCSSSRSGMPAPR